MSEIPRDPIGGRPASPPLEAGLYVVATPIGNLRDVTLRALDVLGAAAHVFAEDTRVTRKLLDVYGLSPRLSAYHEHSGEEGRARVLAALERGEAVALVSDAGTPLVSDPGFKLVDVTGTSQPTLGPYRILQLLTQNRSLTAQRFELGGIIAGHGLRVARRETLGRAVRTL